MHEQKQIKQYKKQQKIAKLLAKQERRVNEPMKEPLAYNAQIEIPDTPPGSLKDLLYCPESYDPAFVESSWFAWWEAKGIFKPKDTGEIFVIPIPPPNITGSLHIGHAMMAALQDTLIRFKRLCGYSTLYIPGTDHAGIATQSVVERKIYTETKLTREDVGREELIKSIKQWKNLYGNKIINQLKRMGSSMDLSRERFTLDDEYTESVNEAFNKFYENGIIFRERKMVNWCGMAKTTLSDLEVINMDVKGGTYLNMDGKKYKFGMLYTFRYPIIGYLENNPSDDIQVKPRPVHIHGELYEEEKIYNNVFYGDLNVLGYVKVSTTRPETILGDTAICLNSDDIRFNIKGCKAINPITRTVIPIIFDDRCDVNFGTGVLKVTPNHDFSDFEIGKKHNLPGLNVITNANTMKVKDIEVIKLPQEYVDVINIIPEDEDKSNIKNEHLGYLRETISFLNTIDGMNRFSARIKVIEHLKTCGLFEEEIKYDIVLPTCSRTGDIIEPMVKKQWWMKCEDLAKKAHDAVFNDEIILHPPESKKVWYNWLDNIRDWCLSRQLWWGHRIPAWRIYVNGSKKNWIVARNIDDLKVKIFTKIIYHEAKNEKNIDILTELKKCNVLEQIQGKLRFVYNNDEYIASQDEDVLDTWFSSGLWPFAILGWPKKTEDLEKFFPSSILETGSDILFFWVARMVMMSIGLTGMIPFKKILLHGIVRDAHGKKMSKSVGNIIDPLYIIEGISLENLVESVQIDNKKERDRAIAAHKKDFPRGIPCCGTDALRFTLCAYSNGLKDVNLDVLRVDGHRRMCNKLWNAFRFVYKTIDSEKTDIEDDITKLKLDFLDIEDNVEFIENLDINNITKIVKKARFIGYNMDYLKPKIPASTDDYESDNEIELMSNPSGEDVLKRLNKLKIDRETNTEKNRPSTESSEEEPLSVKQEKLFVSEINTHLLWILKRRNETIGAVKLHLDAYNFMAATQAIYKFFLNDFCDVFIEIVKRRKQNNELKILFVVFLDIVKLFYPFMPFISEEIFQRMRMGRKSIPLSSTYYPKTIEVKNSVLFEEILSVAHIVRSIIDIKRIKKPVIEIKETDNCQKIAYYVKLLVRNADKIYIVNELSSDHIDKTKNVQFGVSAGKIEDLS